MQEFLGDFICSGCFPVDTAFVFIDQNWFASDHHATQQHMHNMEWMKAYSDTDRLKSALSDSDYRSLKATNLPKMCKATPTTVHSQEAGHHREPVSDSKEKKYDPTWLAYDIARTIIEANRKQVGNLVLLSYEMGHGTQYKKGGTYVLDEPKVFQSGKGNPLW